MNRITAAITGIDTVENLNIVQFNVQGDSLTMMSLDLGDTVRIGTVVKLAVKATNIAIGKDIGGSLSYANQLPVIVENIEEGVLLSAVTLRHLDTALEAIITADTLKKMDLHIGEKVTALIKASEIYIQEIIYE
ncbi:TOBE domain-containing protein [Sulfurovum sp. NBC37-1]|uniref:TOBE domain-containing protein n=1 Tax=Sulfurovum sp. (strain NBC37-1) TaxID=387093 RepID=UPI0001587AFD|nr:TOBE domain-containing protein [Sulfurovum sp. NBC37-1]BAF73045.1 conserved hypothetical protein [Sulfurovum sp. NBC37-1]